MKNALGSIGNKIDCMKKKIHKLKDIKLGNDAGGRGTRTTSFKIYKEYTKTDSIRKGNIRIMGISDGEDRGKGKESLFKEIIHKNFPNLGKELNIHV